MASKLENPIGSPAAADQPLPDGITLRDKAMMGYSLLTSALNGMTGLLKLYLGLQTGAVVVLVKVLTDIHSRGVTLVALATSIMCFCVAAVLSLKLLQGIVEINSKMLQAWASEKKNWSEIFNTESRQLGSAMKTVGTVMEWLFRLAIICAGIFVVGFLVTR